jgi:hypothetical protein
MNTTAPSPRPSNDQPNPHSDPALGQCPAWCEKPPGHEWDDAWQAGPVRFHTWRRQITQFRTIAVEEVEQFTCDGPKRLRDIMLEAQALTPWDIPTARQAHRLLGEALAIAEAPEIPATGTDSR